MSDHLSSEQKRTTSTGLHWLPVLILTILALVGGVWLGRVAFVSTEEPAPRMVDIEVLDDDLHVGGRVELLENREVYVLTINTLPPPPEGEAYVVWVQTGDVVVHAGVWNPNSNVFAFAAWNGRYDTMFVTLEPSPFGSAAPTSRPIITVDLTELEDQDD